MLRDKLGVLSNNGDLQMPVYSTNTFEELQYDTVYVCLVENTSMDECR